ncbi:MAG: pantetheine-phosphate adenylyltransferase [Firmicutes bacterium]|nr:pantetheine-phosphate adenylyltransferase [Bacillota bacterium]
MRIGVYAGTFDPITNGHLDIAKRAASLFDKVIIAVAEDNYKQPLFSIEERCDLIRTAIVEKNCGDNVVVDAFSGLLVDYCASQNACSIIRGLRAISDFDQEFQMALLNRSLKQGIDTVFLMSGSRYLFISSSIIRKSAMLGANVDDLVPPCVSKALQRKYHG